MTDTPSAQQRLLGSRTAVIVVLVLIVVLAIVSQNLSSYHLSLLTRLTIFALAAMGLNLLTGHAGLISVAHAAFMGVGAFVSAYLMMDMGWPALPAMVTAGLIAAVVGLLFGLPSLRLKGVYLVMASFAAQIILSWFFTQATWLTRGHEGRRISRPGTEEFTGIGLIDRGLGTLGLEIARGHHFFLVVLLLTVVGGIVYLNLTRAGTGRAFAAVRDHPIAAQLMGVNLLRTKLVAFGIGHFYAGIAGSLYAWHVRYAAFDSFNIWTSIELLALVIIGGLGSLLGVVLGAAFIVLLPEMLDALGRWLVETAEIIDDVGQMAHVRLGVYGLSIVVFLVFEPRGLARLAERAGAWSLARSRRVMNLVARKRGER